MTRCLALALASCALAAQANPLADVAGGTTTSYGQSTYTYTVAGLPQEFSHNRFRLDFSEMGNRWFYGGVSVGLVFVDAETEPLVSDNAIPGYLFGVFGGIRYGFLDDKLALNFEGRYSREWESGDIDGTSDSTSIRTGEGSLSLGASYRFSELQLSVGAYSSNVVGEVERSGAIVGTSTLADSESSGAYAGFDIKMFDGFALGLRVESGARETIALTFSSGLWRPQ